MIIKDITLKNTMSATAVAGQKQEQDVAFFLRRAFKDNPDIFVIHDFKFMFNEETAQIDHLLVYPYGFILMESKSITGELKVNSFSEWTRSFNNKWTGMPSPIKQVELQQRLLRELLFEHREKILSKFLGLKQGFGMRCWDNICVVSSNAIIDRETMPKAVSEQLVKSEFLVDKINKVMNLPSIIRRILTVSDTRPRFNHAELTSITTFLMDQAQGGSQPKLQQPFEEKSAIEDRVACEKANYVVAIESPLRCKKCGEGSDYNAHSGRYGYYIKCNKCGANTAMKMPCVHCQSANVKVSKQGERYLLDCADCERSALLLAT